MVDMCGSTGIGRVLVGGMSAGEKKERVRGVQQGGNGGEMGGERAEHSLGVELGFRANSSVHSHSYLLDWRRRQSASSVSLQKRASNLFRQALGLSKARGKQPACRHKREPAHVFAVAVGEKSDRGAHAVPNCPHPTMRYRDREGGSDTTGSHCGAGGQSSSRTVENNSTCTPRWSLMWG